MFGLAYIAATIVIAWRWRSKAAYAALPALMATVGLFWADVSLAGAYSSAIWCLSGAWLIYQGLKIGTLPGNGELLAGVLYGISGVIYIALYLGASNETLALVPIISDVSFVAGLVAGTWPNALAGWFGAGGRSFRRTAVQIAREDLACSALHDRGEK